MSTDSVSNSSIYVSQRSGSHRDTAIGHDFANAVLNTGGSNGDGDGNDAAERFVCSFVDELVITICLCSVNFVITMGF
jgi:hypothetical protein